MKSLLKRLAFTCVCLGTSIPLFSQTTENFDTRPGVHVLQVVNHLQSRCWQFSNFTVNNSEALPLQGDGAIISGSGAATASLFTPVLNMWGSFTISFKYSFDASSVGSRAINIYLTDQNNEVVNLSDNIDVSTAAANTTYTYSKTLAASSRIYKINIVYQGGSSMPRMMLDDLNISASKRYSNGCNQAPAALSDLVHGNADRQASGFINQNDSDPNGEAFSCYLVNDSKDGKVSLAMNGYFSFVPNPGFTAKTTSFTYQICDYGYNQLCSEEATVILSFPNTMPVELADLQANYKNKSVTIKWITTSESNSDRFEIERSTDGVNFEKTGVVKALGTSSTRHNYVFDDQVTENYTRKNDLFYRLKQVDLDGKTSYSKILLVRVFKTKTLQTVSVTPNPAVNDIKVHLQLNENAYVVIKLISISGEEVIRKSVKGFSGENSITMEGSNSIRKGIYMLEVIVNSNERMMVKLIKN